MGTASGERACVTTVNAEGKSKITILKAPDWGVDGRADTTRMPLGTETHQWTGCGDNYWMHPTEAGLQVDFFDGRSQLYEGVHTFDATATQDGLYFPQDGAVKFIAVDGTEAWFRPSPEPLELFASLSDAGLFVGRTPTSGWTIHGPSGHVSHIPGLVQWGRGHTVPLVVGLRDGRVQRHNGDLVTSHSGADGRILAVSESTTGLLAASGLGGGASAWPASRSVTGELSRRQARNGSWLGTSTDVVWADGARVLRTIGDAVHEVAVLPEEALLVSGDQGSGVAAMGRTGLYALIDGVVLHSGTHAGRVWPRATPVLLKEQLVEVTSLGLLVHRGDEELLRTLEQLELVEPSPSGDTLWLATGRDETAVVSRMNASLTVTPLSHDVNDAVGVAFMAPQPDGGGLVGTWSGHTLVWQGDAPVVHRVLGPIEGSVNAIDRHNDRIAVGGWHGTVHVFDAEQRAWSAEIGARISSIAWSPSGDYLAVGDDSGGLTVFDSNGEHLSIRTAHRHPVDVRWQAEGGPVTLDTQGIRIQWRTAELVETLSTIQAAGGLTNIRICQDSQQAVPVVPYPSAESVWAPAHLCQALENP
ncbi:MAG: WD40 repeat protein [bacterium]|jgi:WD40 repeat protein